MSNKPYPGTQAVIRAIALLKAFSDDHPEWTLTPLAEELGLNKATTYRLLTALESEELITRDPESSRYRLGPEAIAIGGRALRANNLRTVARPELEQLARMTGETAALERLQGSNVLVLEEVIGGHVVTGTQSIGSRWPAHATSTGKAILAVMPPVAVKALLPEALSAYTPRTITRRDALLQALAESRERGYAVADEELETGLVAVGAPLFDYDGRPVGAVSLAGPTLRFTPERIRETGRLVAEAATRISARLGHAQKRT